jgi:hypothetical protein
MLWSVLKKCLFTRKDVSYEGKRKVYEGLVLAILLYSSECLLVLAGGGDGAAAGVPLLVCPHHVPHLHVPC